MPLFIVFEGGEGSGKSTQAKALRRQFIYSNAPVILTREPGGTQLGNKIRQWIKWENTSTAQTELLLMLAARSQVLSEIINPALNEGLNVICDRYIYSTIAYQGYGRGIDINFLHVMNNYVTNGLQPDIVIFLDIEPQIGLKRKEERSDRFEREDGAFHKRVRQGYLEMANADPARWLVINATLPKRKIRDCIWERVELLLQQS